MHPALLLLLLPLASSSSLHAAAASNEVDNGTTCAPARCGDVSITYPFSLRGVQPLHCGYPAFALTCDAAAGRAYLTRTFREHLYLVRNISYDDGSLVVSVEATFAGNGSCPFPDFNVSSGLALFSLRISAANDDLVIVHNCSALLSRQLKPHNLSCGPQRMEAFITQQLITGESNINMTGVPKNCSFMTVPVRGGGEARDYKNLITSGFLVEWETLGDCSACIRSGGECRFDEGSFRCVCLDASSPCSSRGSKRTGRKIILIVLTSAAAALIFPSIYVMVCHRKGKRQCFLLCKKTRSSTERNYEAMIVSYGSLAPKRYMYAEVMKMTSSRNNQLGKGGYGVVFKGRLHDGHLVAVKFLHDCKGNGDEFVNEVMSIGRTSHVNIVSLFGFCFEGSKRALIYEYMPNGSLDKYIYSENPKEILGWDRLYGIAIGIARGLEYLHHSCNTRIVHFDIKPQNILLDQDFCPKIADFGLAKLCRTKESKLSMTGARGTIGFIAPEVHSRTFGVVSTKSDVYSYGMMLLEMVGGRKNVKSMAEKSSEKYFPEWIYDHFAQDDGLQACEITSEIDGIARKMTLIGLWCIQVLPVYRPTITKVLEMFERSLDELDMPPKQNFCELLEDSAHNMNLQSASFTSPEEISPVNSKILQPLPASSLRR